MTEQKESSNKKFLVKIYLMLLFVAGIIIGFSFLSARNRDAVKSEQLLDNAIVDILNEKGIEQNDVLSQFAQENKNGGVLYHEYHKKIQLKDKMKYEDFEESFKITARKHNVELSKTVHKNGSVEYIFADLKRTLSVVEFVPYKNKSRQSAKNAKKRKKQQ